MKFVRKKWRPIRKSIFVSCSIIAFYIDTNAIKRGLVKQGMLGIDPLGVGTLWRGVRGKASFKLSVLNLKTKQENRNEAETSKLSPSVWPIVLTEAYKSPTIFSFLLVWFLNTFKRFGD